MNKVVKFESKMNKTALTVSEGEYSTKSGAVIACQYYGGLKQQWYMNVENENFSIRNLLNCNALDVEGSSIKEYAAIISYKYHGKRNQVWRLKNFGEEQHIYYIENIKSGMVLEIMGGIDVEGMRVVQNKPYGNLNQLWKMSPA